MLEHMVCVKELALLYKTICAHMSNQLAACADAKTSNSEWFFERLRISQLFITLLCVYGS